MRGLLPRPNRAVLEELIGCPIPDGVWGFEVWGHRIVVMRDRSPDKVGLVHIPENAREVFAAGYVIKIGSDVGATTSKFNGDSPFVNPGHMLGAHVIFGRYCGTTILTPTARNPYDSEWLVMTEDDIWGHDQGPTHQTLE